ncbi:MAG TPA: glycosyltransferase family 4 protein [Gemmatimonadales bacterium]
MRVLVVTHNYPRFAGDPAGAYVARLAQAASAGGAEVAVLAPHVPGTAVDEAAGRVRVHRFRYAPGSWERIGYRGDARARTLLAPATLVLLPLYLTAFRRAARRLARQFHPDVVHAHWWFPGGWVAAGAGTPYLITSHGSDARLLEGLLARRVARGVFRDAARVTAASTFLAGDLSSRLPPLPAPIVVTPMPIDVDAFAAGRGTPKVTPPRILFAGNLVSTKGVDVLIRAVALLAPRGVPCALKILGEGPERGRLQALARELGVADRIIWAPFVAQDRMPAEYGASTITVLPSRGKAEGLGLTLVEALLAGSSVVGTPAGGIPEVIRDGETGLIARDGDAAHWADQLARLLTDSALRARLTDAGAAAVRARFAPEHAARIFLDLYRQARGDHPAH